ncbi:MAG: hypothetical protein AAF662_04655 [Pseudomonadota bacterium]
MKALSKPSIKTSLGAAPQSPEQPAVSRIVKSMLQTKAVVLALVGIATVGYPFIVYGTLKEFGPSLLSVALLFLLVARVVLRGEFHQPEQRLQLILVGSLCLLAALFASQALLQYYPVLMSLSFAMFFLFSLRDKQSLVERFARIFRSDFQLYQIRYMRRLSALWACLLLLNAGAAAYTACCTSLAAWTLYNGAIAYGLFAAVMVLEYGFRQFYERRYQARLKAN